MKKIPVLLALLLLAGCEDNATFWTVETCNTRLEQDIVDFVEYQQEFAKAQSAALTAERRGDAAGAEANRKSAESRKESTRSLLKFIDSNIAPVCEGKFRSDLLAKVDDARKFAEGATAAAVKEEGMPDLRVTSITSAFVPFEMDQFGRCEGPFLHLVFTVTNGGGDFPRPVDAQTFTERAERPAAELQYFTVIGELDFGNEMKQRLDLTVNGDTGNIPSGGTITIPAKVKIGYNQTQAKATGKVAVAALLKNGSADFVYSTELPVPIWDIYTESHQVLPPKKDQDDGKTYILAKAVVTNKGGSPTPGPIQGSFIIKDTDTGRQITSWSEKTSGPVSGATDMYAKIRYDGGSFTHATVESSIIPLCPDGTVGNLADGDTKNNIRSLVER